MRINPYVHMLIIERGNIAWRESETVKGKGELLVAMMNAPKCLFCGLR